MHILIHAGDVCSQGTLMEVVRFNNWIRDLPFKEKIVIAGNHDWYFEKKGRAFIKDTSEFTYLQDESITIDGIKIYGSPWQPEFYNWAFNLPRGIKLKEKWDMIPDDTDILITHGPPLGHNDWVRRDRSNVGCADLLEAVKRVKPKYHIFGHIHSGYGQSANDDTVFINASVCNEEYQPINKPFVIEIEKVGKE